MCTSDFPAHHGLILHFLYRGIVHHGAPDDMCITWSPCDMYCRVPAQRARCLNAMGHPCGTPVYCRVSSPLRHLIVSTRDVTVDAHGLPLNAAMPLSCFTSLCLVNLFPSAHWFLFHTMLKWLPCWNAGDGTFSRRNCLLTLELVNMINFGDQRCTLTKFWFMFTPSLGLIDFSLHGGPTW